MTTILYNSDTEKFISDRMDDGYLVDGKPQAVFPPIYELDIVDTTAPAYDPATQKLESVRVFDLVNEEWRLEWSIIDKTEAELIDDVNNEAILVDESVEQLASDRVLSEMVTTIRDEAIALDDTAALESASLFPPYRIGIEYTTGERFYYPINEKLYKVIGATHTSQLDWTPDTAVSLYVAVTPPDVIAEWVQPLGAQDAYAMGAKVLHNGFTWESELDANVWEPGIYGWLQI